MMSLKIMENLNKEFEGELNTAIKIFKDQYPKKFLHQLISSQLDMDRLDYLKRDSFFTGVSEGSVGINRILKTMRVFKGNVVIEKKGIYAVENYILSRRLMYMQVYLHKTVVSADALLRMIFKRVRYLIDSGEDVEVPSMPLTYFLSKNPSSKKRITQKMLENYIALDDHDVYICIKRWAASEDLILSDLSHRFLSRQLFRTTFADRKERDKLQKEIQAKTKKYLKKQGFPHDDESISYYYDANESYSEAYRYENESIWILEDNNKAVEFSKAADTKHIIALTEPVVKPYLVHLKEI
jgi:HD superfamily phosphohydrolase